MSASRSWTSLVLALLCAGVTGVSRGAEVRHTTRFDLQGHRGARGLRPENTLAAFTRALELGVSTLEMDCAVSRDGVVVVSHDSALNPDLTRGPDGKFLPAAGAPLYTLTFAELQQYDVGRLRPGSEYAARFPEQQAADGQRFPRLADVYALVRKSGNHDVRFNLETKLDPLQPQLTAPPEAFVRALLAVIRDAGMESRTTIQSFDWRTLSLVHRSAPGLVTVALTDQQPDDDTVQAGKPGASAWLGGLDVDNDAGSVPRTVKANGSQIWSPNYLDVDARRVAEAHALGLAVIPWTVNDPKEMERVLALGVDGMISDRPDLLRAVLQSKGIPVPSPREAK